MSKLKSIKWFISRPQYFKTFLYLIRRKFLPDKEGTRDASTEWCKERALVNEVALKKLFPNFTYQPIEEVYPEIFDYANQEVEKCEVQMGGAGDLNFLYYLTKLSKSEKIIETGVAYGWSSLSILLALSEQSGGKLISGDLPYVSLNNDPYVGCVVPESLKSKWQLIRQADRQALPVALKEFKKIDLCHYDSDKSYYGRWWAYPKLWDALNDGGYFVSDDINDNMAFVEFCEKVERKPIVIEFGGKYLGVIKK